MSGLGSDGLCDSRLGLESLHCVSYCACFAVPYTAHPACERWAPHTGAFSATTALASDGLVQGNGHAAGKAQVNSVTPERFPASATAARAVDTDSDQLGA